MIKHSNVICRFSDCLYADGSSYQGNISVTSSGIPCQSWTTQCPHRHTMVTTYPELKYARNYCRNPRGSGQRPWCFTSDSVKRWEYCDIPNCSSGKEKVKRILSLTVDSHRGMIEHFSLSPHPAKSNFAILLWLTANDFTNQDELYRPGKGQRDNQKILLLRLLTDFIVANILAVISLLKRASTAKI